MKGGFNLKYAIAQKKNDQEEYMQEFFDDDCFSDDIGNAVLFHDWRNIPFNVMEPSDYIVKVEEDDEGGLLVVGILDTKEDQCHE
jgi:hypothetical protein